MLRVREVVRDSARGELDAGPGLRGRLERGDHLLRIGPAGLLQRPHDPGDVVPADPAADVRLQTVLVVEDLLHDRPVLVVLRGVRGRVEQVRRRRDERRPLLQVVERDRREVRRGVAVPAEERYLEVRGRRGVVEVRRLVAEREVDRRLRPRLLDLRDDRREVRRRRVIALLEDDLDPVGRQELMRRIDVLLELRGRVRHQRDLRRAELLQVLRVLEDRVLVRREPVDVVRVDLRIVERRRRVRRERDDRPVHQRLQGRLLGVRLDEEHLDALTDVVAHCLQSHRRVAARVLGDELQRMAVDAARLVDDREVLVERVLAGGRRRGERTGLRTDPCDGDRRRVRLLGREARDQRDGCGQSQNGNADRDDTASPGGPERPNERTHQGEPPSWERTPEGSVISRSFREKSNHRSNAEWDPWTRHLQAQQKKRPPPRGRPLTRKAASFWTKTRRSRSPASCGSPYRRASAICDGGKP